MAMTYGKPKISDTITEMKKECQNITVLPLFPFFTKSTTQTIIDKVKSADPEAKIIDRFSAEEDYLDLLAKQIQTAWDKGKYTTPLPFPPQQLVEDDSEDEVFGRVSNQ